MDSEVGVGKLIADVVDLSGTGSDTFVLRMSYDDSGFDAVPRSEAAAAASGQIFLAWLNGSGQWVNAIDGNSGTNSGATKVQGAWDDPLFGNSTLALGAWGVDTANDNVWAVVNHNSGFSVLPEPATMALLGLGAFGLFFGRRRGRKS